MTATPESHLRQLSWFHETSRLSRPEIPASVQEINGLQQSSTNHWMLLPGSMIKKIHGFGKLCVFVSYAQSDLVHRRRLVNTAHSILGRDDMQLCLSMPFDAQMALWECY
jgi:hypothetical protein